MSTSTPVTIARFATMRRINQADAQGRALAERRKNGYRGPLTRAELAARAASRQNQDKVRAILHMI
jgi:hypothetical protein